jgi:hypothetical protein
MAIDARDEAAYAARRLVKRARRGAEALMDFQNEAAYYVKRRPLVSVGVAAGTGLLVGAVAGWIGSQISSRRRDAAAVDDWKAEVGE